MTKAVIKIYVFAPAMLLLLLFAGCCGSYSYDAYLKDAEIALKSNKYEKAKKLYSVIYTQEGKAKNPVFERVANSFYRLGVIAEVQNDADMAIGYYWGDSIDEGYYSALPRLDWLAQTGRKHLEDGKSPRSLEAILALEEQNMPSKSAAVPAKKKPKAQKPARKTFSIRENQSDGMPRADSKGPLSPPPPDAKGPFAVFY